MIKLKNNQKELIIFLFFLLGVVLVLLTSVEIVEIANDERVCELRHIDNNVINNKEYYVLENCEDTYLMDKEGVLIKVNDEKERDYK